MANILEEQIWSNFPHCTLSFPLVFFPLFRTLFPFKFHFKYVWLKGSSSITFLMCVIFYNVLQRPEVERTIKAWSVEVRNFIVWVHKLSNEATSELGGVVHPRLKNLMLVLNVSFQTEKRACNVRKSNGASWRSFAQVVCKPDLRKETCMHLIFSSVSLFSINAF